MAYIPLSFKAMRQSKELAAKGVIAKQLSDTIRV